MQQSFNDFPYYRKLTGQTVWYKISSLTEFEEIVKMGERYLLHGVEAIQFPEKQRIMDMLMCYEDRWTEESEADYESVRELVD